MNRRLLLSRPVLVAAALLLQAVLLVVAVAPRLSARLTGTEYRLAAGPLDPVDPFRGAYVGLVYPGLPTADGQEAGAAFVPLVPDGGLWKGAGIVRQRPAAQPYLACQTWGYGSLSCGIDSLFLPQDEAQHLQDDLTGDRAAAVVKIDRRGNAAVIGVVPR
ncbi:GDYXXLXY domain-containing protein [Sphaerisporangium sp. NPDC049002]|uniref:GDYXXLXY domain-containing protein n=1 Tax=unclassified Sphaerisporangium TaxID=2630420 RepID=UPI0033D88BD2